VERLPDWGAVDEATWNGLVARSATPLPFSTWQFQTVWWRLLGEGRLHLLGVQDAAAEWVAMLPLYEAEPALRLVGGVDVADYLDLIAVASPTVALLPGLAAAAGLGCRIEPDERCPVIELPASWDGYLATLSGKDRHELRRKLRRADEAGARVEVARTPGGIAAVMDSFLALHRRSKVGKARFMDARMEGFFREVGAALAGAGWAALWVLWIAEQPAAALFCLEYGGTVGLYNSGFDPEARALSPGVVLIARTIEDAIRRGYRRYDFLRGDEPYKYGFGAVPTDVLRVTVT
jgi:CelD/BcsL family acetyltransferase involved in cellulose biosynthesis